jgi:hypothetical protein
MLLKRQDVSEGNKGEYMGCDERPDILNNNEEQRMNGVYKKLAVARLSLHEAKIKKSGKNSHQGFQYYELSDFIPKIVKINQEIGLLSNVVFTEEMGTLVVYDTEDGSSVEFTAPMASAQLPGKSQPVQNLGATITYMRRYLYMLAYDITEPDAIDSADQSAFEKGAKGWKNASKQFVEDVRALGPTQAEVKKVCAEFGVTTVEQLQMPDHEKFIARIKHEVSNR